MKMFTRTLKSIRSNILVGFFLIVPVVATILIFNFLLRLATNWPVMDFFPEWLRSVWRGYPLRIITLFLIIFILYLAGLMTRSIIGRRLYNLGDRVLMRIPLVKGIYVSVRQISESLFTQRKTLFKQAVLVQYPRKGIYSIAFVTAAAPESISQRLDGRNNEYVSLFVPTTPNPTSGMMILAPRSEIQPLDMPVANALTFVMSAGAATSSADTSRPTLLDKLEAWLRHDTETLEELNNEQKSAD